MHTILIIEDEQRVATFLKCLPRFSLAVARITDKSSGAAT